MPQWVRERVDENAVKNIARLRGIEEVYRMLAGRLTTAGIPFVALKGITHSALFGGNPENRVQYDIDVFTPDETVFAARDLLMACGYEPIEGMEALPTDHLPALIRKTGWEWRGDFFDVEIPLRVELHFRFWNEALERLPAPGAAEFWSRRTVRHAAGTGLPMLNPADALGYAALHLLKHVLQGSAQAFQVYEIASMLDSQAECGAFWNHWRALHSPELRRLEAVAFRLAQAWFGCRTSPAIDEEIDQLPEATKIWFDRFGMSPAIRVFHANKDELWLHLSLLDAPRDRWSVVRRRLLPTRLPAFSHTAHIPKEQITVRQRVRQWRRWITYTASRVRHHMVSFPRTAASGALWWWLTNPFGEQFWVFLTAAIVFNFALFIFVLLYNLFLLDLGYREDFVGIVNSAMRAGSFAGTLPAAFLVHRLGLRDTLLFTIAATALAEILRAIAGARFPLAALAFASGAVFSIWAVLLAPLIAGAVDVKRRPAAFSVFFATMIAVGICGNWLGGRLPQWFHGRQTVLLGSAVLSALALLPAWRLKSRPLARAGTRVYPRGRFLVCFLISFAVWHLATGSFNPLNNVYFQRLGFRDSQIGSVFSVAQMFQIVALLVAPLLIRRFGLRNGIVAMIGATAAGLGALALQLPGAAAVAAYAAYMSFQWMSEPGLNTMLMDHVKERQRSGASALNYMVAFAAQAIAAFWSGRLIARLGYGTVLMGAALLACGAATLFRILLPLYPASAGEPLPEASAAAHLAHPTDQQRR